MEGDGDFWGRYWVGVRQKPIKTDTAINRIKTDNALKLWLLLRNMDTANNVELHKRLSDT